jgi:hypothetical protein
MPDLLEHLVDQECREGGCAFGAAGNRDTLPPDPPEFSMPWDQESQSLLLAAPVEVQSFAVGNVEEFAQKQGYTAITKQVVVEQMESVGLSLEILTDMA